MRFSGNYSDYIQPDKIDSLSISIFLEQQQDARGGVGANIAYTLALLGDQPVLLGAVGEDAREYMSDLAATGIDTSHVHFSTLPTAAFNVITDESNNQVGGFYPGAMFDSASLTFTKWRDANIVAVVAPHDPVAMRRQIAECKEMGMKLCYDIGQQVSNTDGDVLGEGVEAATILILNDYEMSVLSKKTGLSIAAIKAKVPIVITTYGERGSVIEGAAVESAIEIGIVLPNDVKDPTGAGDAYRAGFLYGYARDWSLEQAGRLGAACATYAIECIGTQAHHFTPEEITQRYFEAYNQPISI